MKVYLVVENENCCPLHPYKVVEVYTSRKAAFEHSKLSRTMWVQVWAVERKPRVAQSGSAAVLHTEG